MGTVTYLWHSWPQYGNCDSAQFGSTHLVQRYIGGHQGHTGGAEGALVVSNGTWAIPEDEQVVTEPGSELPVVGA
jgi:hypothetical protein